MGTINECVTYVTEDGVQHGTREEAEQHDAKLELALAIEKEFGSGGYRAIDMATWIMDNFHLKAK